MKALTLWEPWASAMALGLKRIETPWWTSYRGPLAIHAAARKMTRDEQEAWSFWIRDGEPQYGKILCLVDLESLLATPSEWRFGDYSPGRWAWITTNLRRLKTPIACKGGQGLWNVPQNLLPLIART